VSTPTSGAVRVARVPRTVGDLAVAAGLFAAVALMDTLGPDQRGAQALGWDLALAAPLVVRRAMPEVAAALLGFVALAQWLWGPPLMGDIAVLVMLYTLGARAADRDNRRARWALGMSVLVAQLGVIMAVTRWQPHGELLAPIMLTGTVTASWGAGIYVRTRRAWIMSLRDRAETAEREQHHQAQIAVAAERARIAREMHDVIAHSLSVMITLNDAAVAVGSPGQVRDTVEQASEVGRQALGEMQRLLGVLRRDDDLNGTDSTNRANSADGIRDLTPAPRAEQLVELAALVRSAGLDVELRTTGDLTTLAPSIQLAAYRIVQESLTNVLKHGRNVERVVVDLTRRTDRLEISVSDDGHPRPSAEAPPDPRRSSGPKRSSGPTRGLGLVGMRERALVFGGNVNAGPREGRGWQVNAKLPLSGAARTAALGPPNIGAQAVR